MTKTLTEQQIRKILENGTGKAAKACEQKFYDKPKSLTEQWREGTLEDGHYYVQYDKCSHFIKDAYGMIELKKCIDSEKIKVLSPVPSYTELTLMAGNYKLAKKALRDCYNEMKYWATMNHRCSKIFNHIKAALVEIEEVK